MFFRSRYCAFLVVQNNLAGTYELLGSNDTALRIQKDVYSGRVKLDGEEHEKTLRAANNYASNLCFLQRFEETKSLLRRMMPVARRVLGESHDITLRMRWFCARALYEDDSTTLDDLREAVKTLDETERTARRVLGGSHPATAGMEKSLQNARTTLRVREAGFGSVREAWEAMAAGDSYDDAGL